LLTPHAWTTAQVLAATGGTLFCGTDTVGFTGIGIDSRQIDPAYLFVAVAGERHDGHRFVADAIDRGVKGIVVSQDRVRDLPLQRMAAKGTAGVAVADTIQALGRLARFNRCRGPLTVVAITGSNGKTSTRLLTEKVISQQFATLSTGGNFNNHIGLPLTLFRLSPAHRTAVLELGMNHAGELTYLGGICQPDVAVITNVGAAHLEGLGSIENVLQAKAELLGTLREKGTAILNADDARLTGLARELDHRVVFFGTAEPARVRAADIRLSEAGLTFTLVTPSGDRSVTLATPARVMVANALAAAAVGDIMGVPLDRIKAGLEAFIPQAGRMGIRKLGRDIWIVDDTYNANPASMTAAIETLARMRGRRRAIAVLGDMLELGPQSADFHRAVGQAVGAAGIDRLYVTGRFAAAVAKGAMARQMAATQIVVDTRDAIAAQLEQALRPGDLVLVKGSRGMAMEAVVESIARWADKR
jgi:UDP-N-acetylmuramoyl-tripeptide--D-alanyl-D-alanine ligase